MPVETQTENTSQKKPFFNSSILQFINSPSYQLPNAACASLVRVNPVGGVRQLSELLLPLDAALAVQSDDCCPQRLAAPFYRVARPVNIAEACLRGLHRGHQHQSAVGEQFPEHRAVVPHGSRKRQATILFPVHTPAKPRVVSPRHNDDEVGPWLFASLVSPLQSVHLVEDDVVVAEHLAIFLHVVDRLLRVSPGSPATGIAAARCRVRRHAEPVVPATWLRAVVAAYPRVAVTQNHHMPHTAGTSGTGEYQQREDDDSYAFHFQQLFQKTLQRYGKFQ